MSSNNASSAEFMGDVRCRCGYFAPLKMSWSYANPWKRYRACPRYGMDHDVSERVAKVIRGLLKRANNYEKEIEKLSLTGYRVDLLLTNGRIISYVEDSFVDNGLLMPKFLEELNIREVYPFLREYHMKHEIINKEFSFNDLLNSVIKNIQRSRYERLILNLASAYNGYKFYLPAFLDFRGRIYRSGILHFHERDLARSLIVFADQNEIRRSCPKKANAIACLATAFHFESFNTIRNAVDFLAFIDENRKTLGTLENLPSYTTAAKRPFQFCANMFALALEKYDYLMDYVPITQDAASSAYQIMSYFLLDVRTRSLSFSVVCLNKWIPIHAVVLCCIGLFTPQSPP
nr:DNA-dependent RNA polymerase [Ipomoea batatas]